MWPSDIPSSVFFFPLRNSPFLTESNENFQLFKEIYWSDIAYFLSFSHFVLLSQPWSCNTFVRISQFETHFKKLFSPFNLVMQNRHFDSYKSCMKMFFLSSIDQETRFVCNKLWFFFSNFVSFLSSPARTYSSLSKPLPALLPRVLVARKYSFSIAPFPPSCSCAANAGVPES